MYAFWMKKKIIELKKYLVVVVVAAVATDCGRFWTYFSFINTLSAKRAVNIKRWNWKRSIFSELLVHTINYYGFEKSNWDWLIWYDWSFHSFENSFLKFKMWKNNVVSKESIVRSFQCVPFHSHINFYSSLFMTFFFFSYFALFCFIFTP